MAFQQYFVQEWKSIPTPVKECEKSSACFDCSICLDFARDPVVTLCGHLYCWPCIYKWFDSQSTSDERPQCPVCKAEISEKTMVPLYGRGKSFSESEAEGKVIPPRPPACGIKDLINQEQRLLTHDPHQNLNSLPNPYTSYGGDSSMFNLRGTAAMVSEPVVGMFGEMIYARVFGNSQSLYTYPSSYHSVGNSSPRLRRRELQADQSLNRVLIFLFCCFFLCLLLF